MDSESRKQRDAFLSEFRERGDSLRQMKEEDLSNGDVLEWYVYSSEHVPARAFIIQTYGHGNGIEVYVATKGNTYTDTLNAVTAREFNYQAETGRRYCVRGPYCYGFGDSPSQAMANARINLPGFVVEQSKKKKIPVRWECFQVEAGCDLRICEGTGSVTWSPINGARCANELLTGLLKSKLEAAGKATEGGDKPKG